MLGRLPALELCVSVHLRLRVLQCAGTDSGLAHCLEIQLPEVLSLELSVLLAPVPCEAAGTVHFTRARHRTTHKG